jgi:hypothetical protein
VFGLAAILPSLLASMAWASHAREAMAAGLGRDPWVVCTEAGAIAANSRGEPIRGAHADPECACPLLLTQGVVHAPDPVGADLQPPPRSARRLIRFPK